MFFEIKKKVAGYGKKLLEMLPATCGQGYNPLDSDLSNR